MPIYDYVCSRCDHRTEVVHGMHGHGPNTCPACGAEGTMSKAFVSPAIHFKGTGWAKKDRSATSTPGSSRRSRTEDGATSGVPSGEATGGATAGGEVSEGKTDSGAGGTSSPAAASDAATSSTGKD